jgi:DNA-binding NarL/FixJ family response regulator
VRKCCSLTHTDCTNVQAVGTNSRRYGDAYSSGIPPADRCSLLGSAVNIRVVTVGGLPRLTEDALAALDDACGVIDRAGDFRLADEVACDYAVLDLVLPDERTKLVVTLLRDILPNAKVVVARDSHDPGSVVEALTVRIAAHLMRPTLVQAPAALIVVHRAGAAGIARTAPGLEIEAHLPVDEASHDPSVPLSELEKEILRRVIRGQTDKEIAAELYLSRSSVQNYLARVRLKTGLRRRAELVAWAAGRLD